MFDEIHEECGVFGAYRVDNAASITYYGLHYLQHRGQEASGIAVSAGENITLQRKIRLYGRKISCWACSL